MKRGYFLNAFLFILVVLFVYLIYLGILIKVDFVEKPYSEFSVIGRNYSNSYFSCYNEFKDIKLFLANNNIEGYRDVRIFDKRILLKKNNYYAGKILDRVMFGKLEDFENYSKIDFEEKDYLTYTFPYKNKLSFFIGDFRAYKSLDKELDRRNVTLERSINIYDSINKNIIYLFEIKN